MKRGWILIISYDHSLKRNISMSITIKVIEL